MLEYPFRMGIIPPKMKSEGYQGIITVVSCAMLTFCAYTWQSGYNVIITAMLLGCCILLYKRKHQIDLKDGYKDGDLWESLILSFILAFVILKKDMLPIDVPKTGVGELAVWILLGSMLTILQLPAIKQVNTFLAQEAPARMQKIIHNKFYCKICLFVTICILISQALLCLSTHIWVDEAYTINFIAPSYSEMMKLLAEDVHPPLYYLIVKSIYSVAHLVYSPANDFFIQKAVSLIPHIMFVLMGYILIRRQWGMVAGSTFALASVGMLPVIHYGTEMRMYSWATLFVTCAYVGTFYITKRNLLRYWFLFLVFSTCAAYTHYFAAVAVIPAYAYLLFATYKKPLRWFIFSLLAVLLYTPWLPILIRQVATVKECYWIKPIHYETIVLFIEYTMPRLSALTGILFLGYGVQIVIQKWRTGKRNFSVTLFGFCCICVPYFVIIFGVTVSLILRPIIYDRYISVASDCLWLGLSILLIRNDKSYASCIFPVFILLFTLHDATTFHLTEYRYHKKHKEFINFANLHKNIIFICDNGHPGGTIKTMTGHNTFYWKFEGNPLFSVPCINTPEDLIRLSKTSKLFFVASETTDINLLKTETKATYEYVGDFYIDFERKVYRIIIPKNSEARSRNDAVAINS